MSGLYEIKRSDFSFLRIGKIATGYLRARRRILQKNIRQNYTFGVYDRADRFCAYSAFEIVKPISSADAVRFAHFILQLEDNRFYLHKGVDWYALGRATVRNIQNFRIVQGGSTLSMQLIRNTLIETSKSPLRKMVEILLAKCLENNFSKSEILHMYCEQVYMGNRLRGLQSAAFFIYRKPLAKLTDVEICGVLGLLRAPTHFSPYYSASAYYRRQNFVSELLLQRESPSVEINPISAKIPAYSRICRTTERELGQLLGPNSKALPLQKIGITIHANLKKSVDKLLMQESKDKHSFLSLVVLDNNSGEMVVESSWKQGKEAEFSPSLEGSVQPGSTFKVFALVAALEQGYDLDCLVHSAPFTSRQIKNVRGNPWTVRNYQDIYRGEISLLHAFVTSDNCGFACLAEMLDCEKLFSVYRRFGLLEDDVAYPSIVLGATKKGINPVKLALAYQAIARNGVLRKKSKLVRYAEGYGHDLVWSGCEHPQDAVTVMNVATVASTQIALQSAARSYGLPYFWGKTGTTGAGRVFAGYGKNFSAVVSEIRATFLPMENEHGTDKTVPFVRRLINKLEPW